MTAYTGEQERNIRVLRQLQDWMKSGLITQEQRDRMAADLHLGLRRTNVFLRATLFVFGFLIIQAFTGLFALGVVGQEEGAAVLCAIAAGGCYVAANRLATRYGLYRFGVEESAAVACVLFAGAAAGLFSISMFPAATDAAIVSVLAAGAAVSLAIFLRFGFVYAGIAPMIAVAIIPFVLIDDDAVRRVVSISILVVIFAATRAIRQRHGREFPGDTYSILEAAAWIGIYLLANVMVSVWLSYPEQSGPFFWTMHGFTWLLPALGLWIAVNDRHLMLLDVSMVMAIVTLMTNKAFLKATRYPYDPIVFGVLLVAVAVVLRRWLASGEDGSRNGFVAERILESEKARLAMVGTVSVVHQGPVATHTHTQPAAPPSPPLGGGGRSGGAGAGGSF